MKTFVTGLALSLSFALVGEVALAQQPPITLTEFQNLSEETRDALIYREMISVRGDFGGLEAEMGELKTVVNNLINTIIYSLVAIIAALIGSGVMGYLIGRTKANGGAGGALMMNGGHEGREQ